MLTLIGKHKKLTKRTAFPLFSLGAIWLVLIVGLIFGVEQAQAFSPNYNPNNLIDNPTFVNNSTMSESNIQSFLANVGSGLANFSDVEACDTAISSYYPSCGKNVPAAQIIYDASQAYQINPRIIMATLEKEQLLITDPNPTSAQLNCAMGYNSCNGYVGFFTQVDNGAWLLRFNYERANGDDTWWNSSLPYLCENATSLYSNGLIPGNTVTFTDQGGTAETITIANAATASLYCYTPYVGPYNVTGYSGSYNFVYYYQLWFGTTQTSVAYAWVDESQKAYTDSGYSNPFTGGSSGIYIAPGQTAYLVVDARNVGYQTWNQSVVHLGTTHPQDRSSIFANGTWLTPGRIAMQQSTVSPGTDATFKFSVTAPTTTGTYNEYFNVVADGITWLNDPGLYFTINVVQPQAPRVSNSSLSSGQVLKTGQYILSPEGQNALALFSSGAVLYADAAPVWSTNVSNNSAGVFAMQTDGNLVEYTNSGQAIWASNTAGNPGSTLELQTDGNLVIYTPSGQAIWASNTAGNPNYEDKVDQTIPDGDILFAGQSLQTANEQYQLILQNDGNFVEYYNGKAIWASNTAGDPSSLVAMQPDGNLVIYGVNGVPIWASNTAGTGGNSLVIGSTGVIELENNNSSVIWSGDKLYTGQSIQENNYSLDMQTDGNLVLYDPNGKAVWASNTVGKGSSYVTMQSDGNLVIYNNSIAPIWNSGTWGKGRSILALQMDGNLVIYNSNGATWATNTSGE